jgi:hypothetical protein
MCPRLKFTNGVTKTATFDFAGHPWKAFGKIVTARGVQLVSPCVFCYELQRMKSMPRHWRGALCRFAIPCCFLFTGLLPAWGQSPVGFSEVHFDGTFVILGEHVLDTSDIGVLLQETNPNFQNLSKSNGKDISWDGDGVRYISDAKNLSITWVLDPDFLTSMDGHPTHVFKGKVYIFGTEIVPHQPFPTDWLSKYGFAAAGDQVPKNYQLEQNGWKINIITDRDRIPEAVTLQHSLSPD